MSAAKGLGTAEKPWQLKTPPGTSDYQAYRDAEADPPALVVQVGKTQLRYHWSGEWMPLGGARSRSDRLRR